MRKTKFGHDMIDGFDFDEFYTIVKEHGVLLVCSQIGQTQGTDPHTHRPTLTHSLSGSEQGLSCCSTLVWGFSSVGRVTEGW